MSSILADLLTNNTKGCIFKKTVDAKVAREKSPRIKVVKSDLQPEVTAIAPGTFAQFTAFDLPVVRGVGKFVLDNVRVEIYSFDGEKWPTIGEVFKSVHLIANTSSGNSEVVERTTVATVAVDENTGSGVDIEAGVLFGNNARFTVVGIPREDVAVRWSGRTIGFAVTSVGVSLFPDKKAKVSGNFPIMGTEQGVDANAYAGSVYTMKTTMQDGDGIYPAIAVWGTADVIIKKLAFQDYFGKDVKVSVSGNGGIKEYDCLFDNWNGVTACNFYKKEHELGALASEKDGIYLYSGYSAVFYSKNSARLFSDINTNDIVVVGATMNYRYAPIFIEDGKACFLAGTMVAMGDGSKKHIETIQVGDLVWTGNKTSVKVKKVISKNDPVWLYIVAGGRIVRTVPDQMFFTVDKDGNEVTKIAMSIQLGDWIKNSGGGMSKVTARSELFTENVPTWDLVLEKGNFYYADGFKVHSVIEKGD